MIWLLDRRRTGEGHGLRAGRDYPVPGVHSDRVGLAARGRFAGPIRGADSRGLFAGPIRGANSRGRFAVPAGSG
jgi:hypothetical protein